MIFRILLALFLIPIAVWSYLYPNNLKKWDSGPLRLSRALIYQETQHLCKQGYYIYQNQPVDFSLSLKKEMIEGTRLYSLQKPLPPIEESLLTEIEVVEEDTFDLLLKYQQQGLFPLGLNMANPHHPGGGVRRGAPSQEESLFRRSNYHQALCPKKEIFYPIREAQVIYTPYVQVFREKEILHHSEILCPFLKNPFSVDLVACAFYSLRKLTTPPDGYEEGTRNRIRNILRVAYLTGHNALVLGAAGCGSFANDPRLIAKWFYEELNAPEFKGRFIKIGFGILHPHVTYKNRKEGKKERLNLMHIFKDTFNP